MSETMHTYQNLVNRRDSLYKAFQSCIDTAEKFVEKAVFEAVSADYDPNCGDTTRQTIDENFDKARSQLHDAAELASCLKKVDMRLLSLSLTEVEK